MEKEKSPKRLLNIASFARIYFEIVGKTYENSRKGREAADKNFRLLLKANRINGEAFIKAKEIHLKQISDEIDTLPKTE